MSNMSDTYFALTVLLSSLTDVNGLNSEISLLTARLDSLSMQKAELDRQNDDIIKKAVTSDPNFTMFRKAFGIPESVSPPSDVTHVQV